MSDSYSCVLTYGPSLSILPALQLSLNTYVSDSWGHDWGLTYHHHGISTRPLYLKMNIMANSINMESGCSRQENDYY